MSPIPAPLCSPILPLTVTPLPGVVRVTVVALPINVAAPESVSASLLASPRVTLLLMRTGLAKVQPVAPLLAVSVAVFIPALTNKAPVPKGPPLGLLLAPSTSVPFTRIILAVPPAGTGVAEPGFPFGEAFKARGRYKE